MFNLRLVNLLPDIIWHSIILNRYLHIVCFEVPCPGDYGMAIDTLNRIRAFTKKGIKIHLHYFQDHQRCSSQELEKLCESVHVYERKKVTESLSLHTPYFVKCRCSNTLIENLNKDHHPILLEGVHTTGIINEINKNNRRVCVRMHNEESVFFREQARCTISPVKKTYYLAESILSKKYTPTLPKNCMYACVSQEDKDYLKHLGFTDVRFIPAFPSWQEVDSQTGIGNLCLYHGNLSVIENEKSALWLLCNVFNKVRVPFIIAGKNPSKSIQKAAALCQNTCLVSNPSHSEMDDLLQKAHINILPSFNKNFTGTSLKLLHALYKGRHCVTTPDMAYGTGLESACHVGTNANAIASIISQLYYLPFEEEEILLRKKILYSIYNNEQNIDRFINYLW